jgi:hypothetical protein
MNEIQERLNRVKYPQNYYYNIDTLEPQGLLSERIKAFEKICPEVFSHSQSFLDIGSSLGFFLFKSSANKVVGIEPDKETFEISEEVRKYRNSKASIFNINFEAFETETKFSLIFLGNSFHYLYRGMGWNAFKKLASLCTDTVIMELPLEGEYLVRNGWRAGELMNDYTRGRFEEEANKYFDIIKIDCSATGSGKEREIVVLKLNSSKTSCYGLDLKIKNITEKKLLRNTDYTNIYKVKIDGVNFILKEIFNFDWPLSNVVRSYENYKNKKLSEIKQIVNVYDVELCDNKIRILMEDLSEYKNLIDIDVSDKEYKEKIFTKIKDLFKTLWASELLNYDFTIINFMIKDEDIKMIDLDFITDINCIEAYRLLWFFERIDVISNWYGFNEEILKIKLEVINKWKSHD